MTEVFALLTIYFCYEAHKQRLMSKRVFTIISIIEGIVAVSIVLEKYF